MQVQLLSPMLGVLGPASSAQVRQEVLDLSVVAMVKLS